jgi:hypothetical protein
MGILTGGNRANEEGLITEEHGWTRIRNETAETRRDAEERKIEQKGTKATER